MVKKAKSGRLTKALLETAEDMRRIDVMGETTHRKITLRHPGAAPAGAQLLADINAADASLARGEGRVITKQIMRRLAEDVKRRGRARLAVEKKPS